MGDTDKFEVKIKDEFGHPSLSITNNGKQWSSIIIRNPEKEIPLIIFELMKYFNEHMEGEG